MHSCLANGGSVNRRELLTTIAAGALLGSSAATPATAAAGATTPRLTPPPVPAPDVAGLRRLLAAMTEAGMPGVHAEVRAGRHTAALAAGVADVRTGRPLRPWFRHRVGSVTKTFVATVVLQLVAERRVRLDDPVDRYLPEMLPEAAGRAVTVRMLLNHTSGIGDYDVVLMATAEAIEDLATRTIAPRELVAIGLAQPWTNPPGAAHAYSNTNYVLLGLLIERVTRQRYATAVHRRIIRRLGLRDTYLPGRERRIRGPHSAGYVVWIDGQLRDFGDFDMSWAWAVGDLVSTPHDLNVFFRALLRGELLPPAQLAEMTTTVPLRPADPEAGGYGLGLFWIATPCGRRWGHNGRVIGMDTLSLHSADGREQTTLAENMNFYALPGQPHPIDEARGAFLSAAVCGAPAAQSRATTGRPITALLPQPLDAAPRR